MFDSSGTRQASLFDATPAAVDRELTDAELRDKLLALIAGNGARGLPDSRLAVLAHEPIERVRRLRCALVAAGRIRGTGVVAIAVDRFESVWILNGRPAEAGT